MITRRQLLSAIPVLLLPLDEIFARQKQSIHMLYHPNVPPYSFLNQETGQVEGILIDLIDTLSPALNLDFEHSAYPWKRAQSMLKAGDVKADAFCCPATDERERYALFAQTPVTTLQEPVLFYNPDNPKADLIRSVQFKEDLNPFQGANFLGNSTHAKTWKHHPNMTQVESVELIIKMLVRGHLDFYFANPVVTGYIIRQMGFSGRLAYISLAHIFKQGSLTQMRFGLRRSYPNSKALIAHIEMAIQQTITPEVHDEIINRFI